MLNKYIVHLCLIAGYGRNQWETKIRNHTRMHLYCAPAAVVTVLPWADPLLGDEERPGRCPGAVLVPQMPKGVC